MAGQQQPSAQLCGHRYRVVPFLRVWRDYTLNVAVVSVRSVGRSATATIMTGGAHGFPSALTSFIGRPGPLREVTILLDRYRLVTVTGPGGSGKTRLAAELARRVADQFADGIWLVELAAVRDPAQLAATVAAALGVREQPGVSAAGAMANVLARQQLLLVLDNCEHVIEAAAALCAGLLTACDDLRVLATSREPLAVAGEARYRLGPLTLPGPDDADIAESEAVALFADLARRSDASFALDGMTGPAVAQLVTRLDGLPLAIELAAARIEALGVAQLLDRLDDRFALLAGGDRLAAARQQSLAATVEWSYQLLDGQEQRVFRAVSVFSGPFTLEAAEAVAGPGAAAAVLRLVDCSLLVPPQAGPDGRSRYGMLETLRAYGDQLLTRAGEREGAAAALAGYALRVAEQAEVGLQTSTAEVAAKRWLDAEDAMMRQVLAWSAGQDAAIMVRLAPALAPWWFLRGRLVSECPVLHEAADRAIPGSDAWCVAQYWLGTAALYSADLVGALGFFTALVDAVAQRPPSRALADGLAGRSIVLANLGSLAEAADDGRWSLAVAREIGYPAGEALALERLTVTALMGDDLDSAVQLARQARQVQGDIPGWITRLCSYILTATLAEVGDLVSANRTCRAALAQSQNAGDLQSQVRLLVYRARLDVKAGRAEDAAAHLREALQSARQTGGGFELQNGIECCGYLCAATGRWAEAVAVWAAHAAMVRHEGYVDPSMVVHHRDELLRKARQALGPVQARAAEDRGAAMSMAVAAEYALMLTEPGLQTLASGPGPGQLSARERQLVTLVAQGRTNAQIAAQLHISIRTVSSHLDRIRDKTGCRRRADLTRLALTAGLV